MTLWLRMQNPASAHEELRELRSRNLDRHPSPTIQVTGLSGLSRSHYWLEEDGMAEGAVAAEKPPYRIPSMDEIRAAPANGLTAASTFSGCGGSCLGFRWAGYRVPFASEFVEAARESYAANFPDTHIDPRDVRNLQAEDILEALGMQAGELDVLEGSPPCASFSTAGRRQKLWGETKAYSEREQRVDDLFFEFIRLVRGVQPRAFVAENVSGLLKGVAKGYFIRIMRELKDCGYNVQARLLDAMWLGVPQQRQRVFIVGVRADVADSPAFPKPLPYRYSVREAFEGLTNVRRVTYDNGGTFHNSDRGDVADRPSPAVTVGANALNSRHFTVEEEEAESPELAPREPDGIDPETGAPLEGYAIGSEAANLKPGEQSERYFSLVRSDPQRPSPTVTATGAIQGAASVIHPDGKRKFSIPELRRICGFPDDFRLLGSYGQQWERLGRAVPPPMAYAVAEALGRVLLDAGS